ncbi:MAG: ATP-grasp domain-containing protein [Clostridia bacterium]|jgi:hypothetical protein|nr:ATP-grasp domain-containing protein [Clostridia bacterium]
MDKSSFNYWYPKIEGKLNTPKSIIIEYSKDYANKILTRDFDLLKQYISGIIYEMDKHGISFPVFLKTDTYSAKWYWSKTCFVKDSESLKHNIMYLLYLCEEDDSRPVKSLIIKEYIELKSNFNAFCDMPINKERRYFIENKKVLCHHPYWDAKDIEFFNDNYPENWEELLSKLNIETDDKIYILTNMAERFGELIDGDNYFSVDFAQDKYGVWYLIDSAMGNISYHNEDCPVYISHN